MTRGIARLSSHIRSSFGPNRTPKQRGAAAVEFAIGALLLITMALGAGEFGLLLSAKHDLNMSVRLAGRVAATPCAGGATAAASSSATASVEECAQGNAVWDDFKILRAVESGLGGRMNEVEKITIYSAPLFNLKRGGGAPSASCLGDVGVTDWCNVYTNETLITDSLNPKFNKPLLTNLDSFFNSDLSYRFDLLGNTFSCSSGPSKPFCPTQKDSTNRSYRARSINAPTSMGIYVKMRHSFATGVVGQNRNLTAWSMFKLEPHPLANDTLQPPGGGTTGRTWVKVLPANVQENCAPLASETQCNVKVGFEIGAELPVEQTINFKLTPQTAKLTTDYLATSTFEVTIPAGQKTAEISVPIVNDSVVEATETFHVTITNTSSSLAPSDASSSTTGVVTITDDETKPTIKIVDAADVTESTPAAISRFKVTLSAAVTEDQTFKFKTSSGTATATKDGATDGVDYNGFDYVPVIIAAGTTEKFVDVTIVDDPQDELKPETFNANISSFSGLIAATGNTTSASGTIIDNDEAAKVSISGAENTEGSTISFELKLNQPVATVTKVKVSTSLISPSSTTTASSSDFTARPASLDTAMVEFAANATTATFEVQTTSDTTHEKDEEFTVTLSDPDGGISIDTTKGAATGRILNDDAAPTVSITSKADVAEGLPSILVIKLTHPTYADQNFTYSTTTGTAIVGDVTVAGVDAALVTNRSVSIPAGSTDATEQSVATRDDTVEELTEQFNATLTIPATATGLAATGHTLTAFPNITDTDVDKRDVQFDVDPAAVLEPIDAAASYKTMTFTVNLDRATPTAQWVKVTTANGSNATAALNAIEPDDYLKRTTSTVNIAANASSATFTVRIYGDDIDELSETFTVSIVQVSSGLTAGTRNTATGTITDNDATPTVSIVEDRSVAEGNVASPATTNHTPAWVTCASENTTCNMTGTRLVRYGVDTRWATATKTGSFGCNNGVFGDPAPGTGKSCQFDSTNFTGSAKMTFTVRMSGASSTAQTVNFSAFDSNPKSATGGTASGTGIDYLKVTNQTVTFSAGTKDQTVDITVYGDNLPEPNETFGVNLSDPVGGMTLGSKPTGIGTIVDDERTISIADVTVAEPTVAGTTKDMTFTLTLTPASTVDESVEVTTSNDTAIAPDDYVAFAQKITITAGQTTKTFVVKANHDTIVEPTEQFKVTLSSLSSGIGSTGNITSALGKITNTGSTPTVTGIGNPGPTPGTTLAGAANNATAVEGNPMVFRVTFTGSWSSAQTLIFSTVEGTAKNTSDFTPQNSVSITIPAGQNWVDIPVPTTEDTVAETPNTEQFTIRITSIAGVALSSPLLATGTITDDDIKRAVSIAPASADEGNDLSFVISLAGGAHPEAQTVTLTLAPGTALVGSDYTAAFVPGGSGTGVGTVTIPAGQTSVTVTVKTIEDLLSEPPETFSATISNLSAGLSVGTLSSTGTINDDDAPITVTLGIAPTVIEGGKLKFPITISRAPSTTQTVTFKTTIAGSATAGSDFIAIGSQTVTFLAGSTAVQYVEVSTNPDNDVEGPETVGAAIDLTAGTQITGGTLVNTGTITSDDVPPVSIQIETSQTAVEGLPMTFKLTLSAPSTAPQTITFTASGGTASASDYSYNGSVNVPAGVSFVNVTVATDPDTIYEGSETFNVSLSNPSQGLTITGTAKIGTITDNDAIPTVSISPSSQTLKEGVVGKAFTITLSNPSSQSVTMTFSTQDGTAFATSDYNAVSVPITFTPGQTSKTSPIITATDDEIHEVDGKTFTAKLTSLTGAAASGNTLTANGLIDDNDPQQRTFTITKVANPVEGQNAEFTITLSGPITTAQTITIRPKTTGLGSTYANSSDLTDGFTAQTYTIQPGVTPPKITVQTFGDSVDESDEEFAIEVISVSTGLTFVPGYSVTTTILDNDEPVATTVPRGGGST